MILIQFVLLYIIYIRFYMFFYIIVFKQKFIHPYLYIFYMWLCSRIFLFFLLKLWKCTSLFSCLFLLTFLPWRITFFYMNLKESCRFRNVDVICVGEGNWIIWQYQSNIAMFVIFRINYFLSDKASMVIVENN